MISFNACYDVYKGPSHDANMTVRDNTEMYIILLNFLKNAKCKVLFSINDCAITRYLYKDFIKDTYNKQYQYSQINIKDVKQKKKNTNILIITNF